MANLQVTNRTDLDPQTCLSRINALLDKVTVLSLATVTPDGDAYVNTAFFSSLPAPSIVLWTSPLTEHARNLATNRTSAATVFDPGAEWGSEVCGVQLFGTCAIAEGDMERVAFDSYSQRFPRLLEWAETTDEMKKKFQSRLYVLQVQRARLLDEQHFGRESFVDATFA